MATLHHTQVASCQADAAWQNFEKNLEGTLEAGKLADIVVLPDDPLNIDPTAIKDIRVMETIKEGKARLFSQGVITQHATLS